MAKLEGLKEQPSFVQLRNPQFGQGSAEKAPLGSMQPRWVPTGGSTSGITHTRGWQLEPSSVASPCGDLVSSLSAKSIPRVSVQRHKMETSGLGTALLHFYCILLAYAVTVLRLHLYAGGVIKKLGSVFSNGYRSSVNVLLKFLLSLMFLHFHLYLAIEKATISPRLSSVKCSRLCVLRMLFLLLVSYLAHHVNVAVLEDSETYYPSLILVPSIGLVLN